eukprot:137197-Alexandrium_andersonii.AAC.1
MSLASTWDDVSNAKIGFALTVKLKGICTYVPEITHWPVVRPLLRKVKRLLDEVVGVVSRSRAPRATSALPPRLPDGEPHQANR